MGIVASSPSEEGKRKLLNSSGQVQRPNDYNFNETDVFNGGSTPVVGSLLKEVTIRFPEDTRESYSHENTRSPSNANTGCLWGCIRTGSVLLRSAWGMYEAHPYPHAVSEVPPRPTNCLCISMGKILVYLDATRCIRLEH